MSYPGLASTVAHSIGSGPSFIYSSHKLEPKMTGSKLNDTNGETDKLESYCSRESLWRIRGYH